MALFSPITQRAFHFQSRRLKIPFTEGFMGDKSEELAGQSGVGTKIDNPPVRGTFSFWEIARNGQGSGRSTKCSTFKTVLTERAGCKRRLPSLCTGLIVPCLSNLLSWIILLISRFDTDIPSKDSLSEIFWPDNPLWRWTQTAARTSELQRARYWQWDIFIFYSSSSSKTSPLKRCSV